MHQLLELYYSGDSPKDESKGPSEETLTPFTSELSNTYSQILVFFAFVLVITMISVAIRESKYLHPLVSLVPESALLLVFGALAGFIAHFLIGALQADFQPIRISHLLLRDVLIAPIILHASYDLYHPQFFLQFGSIMALAFLATIMNTLLTGLTLWGVYARLWAHDVSIYQCLIFASIISAVDPVAVLAVFESMGVQQSLYYLVFGEALLNDGVTFVLFEGLKEAAWAGPEDNVELGYLAAFFLTATLGGAAVGAVAGALSSLVTKHIKTSRSFNSSSLITLMFVVLGYMLALLCNFSSIIAIIACGLTQMRYTITNLHPNARLTIRNSVQAVANTFETIIFVLLGNQFISIGISEIWPFALVTIAAIYVWRLVVTAGLSLCLNMWRKRMISYSCQAIIWVGGLRGAIAYTMAIIYRGPHQRLFQDTTLLVIFVTVLVNGVATKPLVHFFHLMKKETKRKHRAAYFNKCLRGVAEYAGLSLRNILGEENLTRDWQIWLQRFERRHVFKVLCKDSSGQCQMVRDLWQHERQLSDKMLERHLASVVEDRLTERNPDSIEQA